MKQVHFFSMRAYYLKLSCLAICSKWLISYYRPYQNEHLFYDWGVADSAPGLFSIWLVYTLVTPQFKGRTEALQNAKGAITIFVVQEILSLFYPEIIGTFDIGDILYYLLGAWIIFEGDVKRRNEEPFHAYQLKYGSATAYSDESLSS